MNVEKIEKTVIETVNKLEKLNSGDTLAAELSWCWFSYKNDQNPIGLKVKTEAALSLLLEAREKNSRAVSKKLVTDLEKILVLN